MMTVKDFLKDYGWKETDRIAMYDGNTHKFITWIDVRYAYYAMYKCTSKYVYGVDGNGNVYKFPHVINF